MVTMQEIMLKQQIELHPIIKPYENTLRAFFTKYISYEALKDEIAELYMSRFSELQLRQMVAFYQTPTGRLAAKELPAVMELAAEIGKRNVAKHMPELKEMLTHPDAASAPPAP
jgi:hypothetical protein